MKYVVLLADGMADYPVPELNGKTPLEAASTPTIDSLTPHGEIGMVKTIPDGMPPGSDTANLAVFGYDPATYYTGRSPFEAISIGIPLAASDVVFRCNLVTLTEDEPYAAKTIVDHSSDEITTAEAAQLMETIKAALGTEAMEFHSGFSYRHILVWHDAPFDFTLTPPHDILGKKIREYLPAGPYGKVFLNMMEKSYPLLAQHPINIERQKQGLNPANSIWIWGEGKKPLLPSFQEKYGLKGSVISAVDLIKGLGLCVGFTPIDVPGATGNYHTNYQGKVEAALKELQKGQDFVYIHIEAPDECGHRYEIEQKVKSIEAIDLKVLKPLLAGLTAIGEDYKIMLLPDHPTPLSLRTHTNEPVPFLIYQSNANKENTFSYNEIDAPKSGLYIQAGHRLMDYFLGKM
jgi:2,3-bisphosphoglycerate-independent phosphoglycerate mutase